jgi:hypothetical protein
LFVADELRQVGQVRLDVGIIKVDRLPAELQLVVDPIQKSFLSKDCGNTRRGLTSAALYSSIIF